MRKLRFFVDPSQVDRLASEPPATGERRIVLPVDEGRHLRVSLRGRVGDEVSVFDGRGRGFSARVALIERERVEVILLEEDASPVEPPLALHLLQAVSRDEIFERAVDQATALGVATIVPVLAERGKTGARAAEGRRIERWGRIAREAAKLSWRRVVPAIGAPIALDRLVPPDPPRTIGLLLDPAAPAGALRSLLDGPRPAEILLAVGPEGGFSDAERDLLVRAGFRAVSVGPRILRTEHAGSAIIAILLSRWGDVA